MPSRPKKLLLQYDTKRFPEELFHLHVQAILVGFKLEADGDYHLVLADLEDPRKTMIAEIPSPECITMDLQRDMWALRKAFDDAFGKPTSKFKKARPGVTVSVEGILFRDFAHRQTGAAPSQTEIHPVLSLERRTVKLPADSAWRTEQGQNTHCGPMHLLRRQRRGRLPLLAALLQGVQTQGRPIRLPVQAWLPQMLSPLQARRKFLAFCTLLGRGGGSGAHRLVFLNEQPAIV